ncbi:MAG: transposase [Pseudomonadota bacterium]
MIIMDNAAFHKSKETQNLIKKAGCYLLFLPLHSPHLNPIEKSGQTLKELGNMRRNTP